MPCTTQLHLSCDTGVSPYTKSAVALASPEGALLKKSAGRRLQEGCSAVLVAEGRRGGALLLAPAWINRTARALRLAGRGLAGVERLPPRLVVRPRVGAVHAHALDGGQVLLRQARRGGTRGARASGGGGGAGVPAGARAAAEFPAAAADAAGKDVAGVGVGGVLDVPDDSAYAGKTGPKHGGSKDVADV